MWRTWTLAVVALLLTACSASPPGQPIDPQQGIPTLKDRTLPFETGLVANSGPPAGATGALAAPLVRVEFPIGTAPADMTSTVDGFAAQGSRVLLLAGFYTTIPTADQARSLAGWARAFGPASGRENPVTTIEFGNETSYTYQYDDEPGDSSYASRARTYGELAATAADAIRSADPDVGLLAQADDGNTNSSDWVDNVFAAAPDLDDRVAGWVVHPYGPSYSDRLSRTRDQLAAHGASGQLWITEWGVAFDGGRCLSDNYGWDPCMDDAAAATALLEVVRELPDHDVAAFLIYQAHDQDPAGAGSERESYFGVLTHDGGQKGLYTEAVRALWQD